MGLALLDPFYALYAMHAAGLGIIMTDVKAPFFSLKDLFVLIPLAGTTIAALYEVGFFYGIGLSYFTLFSLSEHIVFALTALPFAVGLTLMLPSAYLSYKLGERYADKSTPPIPTTPVSVEEVATIRVAIATHKKKTLTRLVWFSVIGMAVAGLTLYLEMYATTAIMFCMALAALTHALLPEIATVEKTMTFGFLLGALVVSFCAGLDSAKWIFKSTTATEAVRLAEGGMQGRLIRSGERGVLFFDQSTKKITFLLWPDIKRIVAQ